MFERRLRGGKLWLSTQDFSSQRLSFSCQPFCLGMRRSPARVDSWPCGGMPVIFVCIDRYRDHLVTTSVSLYIGQLCTALGHNFQL